MGSHADKTMIAALCGAMWLTGCGGGEGNPRPDNAAGMGATGGSTGGTGGSGAGTGGTAAGSAGMPADKCATRTMRTGGVINAVEEVGADGNPDDPEHRRFPTGDGGWFIYHASPDDMQCPTDACTTTPPRDDHGDFTLSTTTPERSGSMMALHLVGTGFPMGAYGGGVGMYLDCASLPDTITGYSFWYRSDIALQVGVTSGLPEGNHITSVPAADQWTQAMISFGSLSPEAMAPPAIDRSKFGALFFRANVPPMTMTDWGFDVWLDDVAWIGGS